MSTAPTNFIYRFCNLFWLAGPIFTMELRISARRKRNYFLRFAYAAILTLFVASAWSAAINSRGGSLRGNHNIFALGLCGLYHVTKEYSFEDFLIW